MVNNDPSKFASYMPQYIDSYNNKNKKVTKEYEKNN